MTLAPLYHFEENGGRKTAAEAVPVVDEVEPMLNKAKSKASMAKDNLAEDYFEKNANDDHRKDDTAEGPEEQSDDGSHEGCE